ncbi:MAG TPA: phosphate ABC transporter substrate-binding protein PstS [Gemmatimonadaceae bacterium]|nr:phosphate ABC transporter substrate-binding protein PstS [Gemmatimonadaceae bacterium]
MPHVHRWLAALLVLSLSSCASEREQTAASEIALDGAGATFPYPVYTRWFSHFASTGGARINYRSIGSGAGVRALLADLADFAATDVPLTVDERAQLASQGIRQVPLVVGGVAITYNVPSLPRQLRLDGETLADIFLGRIAMWDDARLVAQNPDVTLPHEGIRVITRGDTSGTSWILTDYLDGQGKAWAAGPGRSRFPAWPVGTSARGNEGVAAAIKVTEYSFGAVEAVYAMQNRLQVARIRNHAGAWVTPQTGALRAAASAMLGSMDDTVEFAGSISDAPGETSYPIASLSWLIVPSRPVGDPRVQAMNAFVRWALENGQDDALALGYAPLPAGMRTTLLKSWSAPTR